jgi:hypothetical protein
MMMRITTVVILASVALAPAARAQEEISTQHEASKEWNEAWIDRPLLLAPGAVQAGLGMDVSNLSVLDNNATGETVSAAVDVGLSPRWQAGLALTVPVNPASFGSAIANLQMRLSDAANLRLDVGVARGGFIDNTSSDMTNDYMLGVSIPLKLKLSSNVALISGRTGPAGFARPLAISVNGMGGIAVGATPFYMGESLFSVGINGNGVISMSANAPVGVMVALSDRVAVDVHGGYRWMNGGNEMTGVSQNYHFLPFGGDVMVNLPGHIDVGVSADVAGPVSQNVDYLSTRQFMGWLQARF